MKKLIASCFAAACLAVWAGEQHPEHGHAAHEHHEHGHAEHEHHEQGHGHAEHAHPGHAHHDPRHDHDPGHAGGKALEVPASVQRTMGVKTVKAEKRRLKSTQVLTGRFELAPDARFSAVAPVAGRVSLGVAPLARVKAGDALFTVESPDLLSRSREIAVLEKRLAVYRGLKTANAELEAQLAVKRGELAAILGAATASNGVVTVRAKADGQVETFALADGSWAESGTQVLGFVRPDRIRFKAFASVADAAQLADGGAAAVKGAEGRLRLGLGDGAGMADVYVEFPQGAPAARAGERARAECVLDASEKPVLCVPDAAIVRIGLQPTVFVRDGHDADRFLAVPVETGLAGGGWTEVKALDDDAEVVTDGAYEFKLALGAGTSAPAGHFHADGTFHEGEDH
ncbi:MAG: hypothetical protein PUE68_05545 [Kiritimatiellae bacterium]|nr:hypothetical protein [Kiritimatiellia bacterium]